MLGQDQTQSGLIKIAQCRSPGRWKTTAQHLVDFVQRIGVCALCAGEQSDIEVRHLVAAQEFQTGIVQIIVKVHNLHCNNCKVIHVLSFAGA